MLNITTKKLKDNEIKLSKYNTSETITLLNKIQHNQKNRELGIINQQHICPVNRLNTFQEELSGLKPEKFKSLVKEQFYNPELMTALMCTVDSLYYSSSSSLAYNERIRNWLQNLRQIGAESAYGYAMLSSLGNVNDAFVIKAPRKDLKDDDLQHELFVGMFGTNRLRKYVPNFVYVFGGFRCSPPIIDPQNRDVTAWCNNTQNNVSYVVYENLNPSISFGDYARNPKITAKDFINKYIQILYALRKGKEICDFTSYDLHHENVLIRYIEGQKKIYIPYETEKGKVEYLATDAISTIIDYGYTHINYGGQSYGQYRQIPGGIYPDRSFILSDAYKLLLFCALMAANENEKVYNECAKLLRFFNREESLDQVLRRQRDSFYALQWLPEIKSTSFDDFIKYIRQVCDCSFITDQPGIDGKTVSCKNSKCDKAEDALRIIGMRPSIPQTMIEYYDLASRPGKIVKGFNARAVALNDLTQLEKYIAEALAIGKSLRPMRLLNATINTILNVSTLYFFRKYIAQTAAIYDLLQRIDVLYDAYLLASEQYPNDLTDIMIKIKQFSSIIEGIRAKFNESLNRIGEDVDYLDRIKISQKVAFKRATDRNNNFAWYFNGMLAFDYMLAPK